MGSTLIWFWRPLYSRGGGTKIRLCKYKAHFIGGWSTFVATIKYGRPAFANSERLVSIWKSLCVLFTTRSNPPAAILEPCGRKYTSIRRSRTSSIALTGVSIPLNALKLKERKRIPYSRLLLALGFPIKTKKSLWVKLSAFKESSGAAVVSLFHKDILATFPCMSLLGRSLKSVPITIKMAVADMPEMGALPGSIFATLLLVCMMFVSTPSSFASSAKFLAWRSATSFKECGTTTNSNATPTTTRITARVSCRCFLASSAGRSGWGTGSFCASSQSSSPTPISTRIGPKMLSQSQIEKDDKMEAANRHLKNAKFIEVYSCIVSGLFLIFVFAVSIKFVP